jgi:UrcA family protein
MPSTFSKRVLAAAAAAGCLTLAFGAAHAQGYDDDYGYGPSVGTVTVSPPYRYRSWNGAPVEVVRASRVVDISDLDLNTDWGRGALYDRVERAAADACAEVDSSWTMGLYPTGQDSDCVGQTINRAMADVYGGD